jgi:hypothetical protein
MHKPFYLVALFAATLSVTTARAQTTKGTRVLGLSAGKLSYKKNENFRQLEGLLTPSAGVFVANNLALGVSVPVTYTHIKYKAFYTGTEKVRGLTIGLLPWLRYHLPSTSRHRVFGELSVGGTLYSARIKQYGYAASSSTNVNVQASAGLGYSYFLTPSVGLEALLAYSHDSGTSEAFGRGALGLNLGFRVYLPKGGTAASNQ